MVDKNKKELNDNELAEVTGGVDARATFEMDSNLSSNLFHEVESNLTSNLERGSNLKVNLAVKSFKNFTSNHFKTSSKNLVSNSTLQNGVTRANNISSAFYSNEEDGEGTPWVK